MSTLDQLRTLDTALKIADAIDGIRNAAGPGSTLTHGFSKQKKERIAVPAPTAERRIAQSTDRVDPKTGEVLDEHEALARMVGLEAAIREIEHQIGEQTEVLKDLKSRKDERLNEIRGLIRLPQPPAPTPLFDGQPA